MYSPRNTLSRLHHLVFYSTGAVPDCAAVAQEALRWWLCKGLPPAALGGGTVLTS